MEASTISGSTPSTSTGRNQLDVLWDPDALDHARMDRADTARVRVLAEAVQKFTPDMFLKSTGGDPWTLGQKDVDDFRTAIEPLAAAGNSGAG